MTNAAKYDSWYDSPLGIGEVNPVSPWQWWRRIKGWLSYGSYAKKKGGEGSFIPTRLNTGETGVKEEIGSKKFSQERSFKMSHKIKIITTIISLFLLASTNILYAAEEALQKQVEEIKAALPKFAIPMREVGDRFQDMYYAAKGGNWGLAAYMSKYMNGAMNPAKVTKPKEYEDWRSFYTDTFAPVNKAIAAQDFKAFSKEYDAVIKSCNACHDAMGYTFIKVIKMNEPADKGVSYSLKSKATDVPK